MLTLLLIFLLFLVTISILKTQGGGDVLFNLCASIPHHDKWGHFFLMGILGFLLLAVLSPLLGKKYSRAISIYFPTISLITLIGIEEFSQHFLSTRSCSWADFGCGALGILVAMSSYLFTRQPKDFLT